MAVRLQVSEIINRPVSDVFQFVARDHVRNHPRWDPDIELEQISDGPLGLGTVIRRRNYRSGTPPIEGTMKVVEFVPDRSMGTEIRDGQFVMYGRSILEPIGDNQTNITIRVELPDLDESTADTSFLKSRMERSIQNMKALIESEILG